jgi:hypothetical protein
MTHCGEKKKGKKKKKKRKREVAQLMNMRGH